MYLIYLPLRDETLFLESPEGGWIPTNHLNCHLFAQRSQAQEALDRVGPPAKDPENGWGKSPRIRKLSEKEVAEVLLHREDTIKKLSDKLSEARKKLRIVEEVLG